jgi:hypothetical protein
MKELIEIHFEYLKDNDPSFKIYWEGLSKNNQEAFVNTYRQIESQIQERRGKLDTLHYSVFETTKRWFVRVQEKEFLYSKIPKEWQIVVRDLRAKEEIFYRNIESLKQFVDQASPKVEAYLYGNIKPDSSLDRKLLLHRDGNAVQTNLLDIWDLVRYRIVVKDMDALLVIGIHFWEYYFDDIIRCRNYYYRPKNGNPSDPYRAIHFQLRDKYRGMVEVQVITRRREVGSFFDHALIFKNYLSFLNYEHEEWLKDFLKKINVLDAKEAHGPS